MRVLVCGSRTFNDYKLLEETLDAIGQEKEINTIIHGMARGADTLGGEYAKSRGIGVFEFPADWKQWGKRAGPIRNSEMLRVGLPDVVVAFWDGWSQGTHHMIGIAKEAGVEVKIVRV